LYIFANYSILPEFPFTFLAAINIFYSRNLLFLSWLIYRESIFFKEEQTSIISMHLMTYEKTFVARRTNYASKE